MGRRRRRGSRDEEVVGRKRGSRGGRLEIQVSLYALQYISSEFFCSVSSCVQLHGKRILLQR